LTEGYITQLSHTWSAFRQYIHETGHEVTHETGLCFLKDYYDIAPKSNYLSLSRTNKRRKRAISVLINCMEHGMATAPKTHLLGRFDQHYETIFSEFIAYRKMQSLSLSTVNRDIYCLNKLSEYFVSLGLDTLSAFDSSHAIGFMKWLSRSGKLPTMRSAASTLRLLTGYLYHIGVHKQNISEFVPKVKVKPDGIPSTYKPDEIQTMLNSFNRSSQVGTRDYAMVLLAVRLGMRASDICALKFENLNWQTNTIVFNSIKTGRHTILPLTEEVGRALIEYLRSGRPETIEKYVFIRFQKPYRELRSSILHAIVTKAMRNSGIIIQPGKRHGPHALRASLASEMLAHNTPLPVISETLSHANSDTTRIYLKIDIVHLRPLSLDVPSLGNVWMGGVPV
jgi:integrase